MHKVFWLEALMTFFCLNQPFASAAFALCIFWSLFLSTFATAICYYPNQKIADDVPCSDSGEHISCCGKGYACLSNKVCRMSHQDANGAPLPYTYGRGSCTDQDWRSQACPNFCLNGKSRKHTLRFARRYECPNRTHAALGMDNCDQATEHLYCCGTLEGSRTQDWNDDVPGICDCNATEGPGQPLQFEGNATAITTIGAPDSSTSQMSSTFSNSIDSPMSFTSSRPSSSSVFSSASASTLKARQSLTTSEPLTASSKTSVASSKSPVESPTSLVTSPKSPIVSSKSFVTSSNSSVASSKSLVFSSKSLLASSKSPVASSPSIPQPSKNRAAIIGSTVGVTVPLLSVAALAFFFRRRKQKTKEPLPESNPNELARYLEIGPDRPHEHLASTGERELQASLSYHELPVNN